MGKKGHAYIPHSSVPDMGDVPEVIHVSGNGWWNIVLSARTLFPAIYDPESPGVKTDDWLPWPADASRMATRHDTTPVLICDTEYSSYRRLKVRVIEGLNSSEM